MTPSELAAKLPELGAPEPSDRAVAVPELFRTRRRHRCAGCGSVLLHRHEIVRVSGLIYHRGCASGRAS